MDIMDVLNIYESERGQHIANKPRVKNVVPVSK